MTLPFIFRRGSLLLFRIYPTSFACVIFKDALAGLGHREANTYV